MANVEIPINEMSINGAYVGDSEASAILTFSGNVADGELLIIGNEIYEFDTNSSVTQGHIAVNVSGGVTPSQAISALKSVLIANSVIVAPFTGTQIGFLVMSKRYIGTAISTTIANASLNTSTLVASKWMNANNLHTYYMPNDGKTYIEVGNASGYELTVTFEAVKKCSHDAVHTLEVVIPIATTKKVGAFDMTRFNQAVGDYTGAIKITLNSSNVRLTAFRLP